MQYLTAVWRLLFGIPGVVFWLLGAICFAFAGGHKGLAVYLNHQ